MSFITDEVKAKRAASLEEARENLEALRINEFSRFLEEWILEFCEEARKAAVDAYFMTGKLPDKICISDHNRLVTPAVANIRGCRKELLKKLQSLGEKVCGIEFQYTDSNSWGISTDPCIVIYFSNNQE